MTVLIAAGAPSAGAVSKRSVVAAFYPVAYADSASVGTGST